MENKAQHKSVMMALAIFTIVIVIVGAIGYFTIGRETEIIQGQIDVEEYRVSCKVPARILEIRVKEGDYVSPSSTPPTWRRSDSRRRARRARRRQ